MQSLPKLSKTVLEQLRASKNLLAFSGGSDSTALFFILLSYEVPFDIALVNYQTRLQSEEEATYAKELAHKYKKMAFIHSCKIKSNNFEHEARKERYSFFEEIIEDKQYDNLLMAHHLADQLEWFLMQLSKGAGLVEMIGMQELIKQKGYTLIRPLLHVSKEQINTYLEKNRIKHFIDSSNMEEKYMRNHIRKNFAKDFLAQYEEGVRKSFEYLSKDAQTLMPEPMQNIKELFFMSRNSNDSLNIRGIDKVFKELGYLLSSAQRSEILRTKECIIAKKYAVAFSKNYLFIAPTCKVIMPKTFKEACRIADIPSKIRPYLYKESIEVNHLLALMS